MSGIMQAAIGNWKSAAAATGLIYNLDASVLGGLPGTTITTSASFNGSTQYFDIASTTAFGFGTADFTIEFWWRPTADVRSDILDFWTTPSSNPVTRFDIGEITSTTLDLYTDGTGGSSAKITGPSMASLLNSWHHIAVTRQSGSIYMWVDGTQAGSTYSANVLDMGTGGMNLRIMGDHGASGNGSGNLSNIRVVTGTALYTATFTPPTTTLRAVSGTALLLSLSGAPFMDLSSNLLTVTNNGTTTTSVQAPSLTTGTTDVTGTYTLTYSCPTATFTGSITGTTLTVSGVTGTITTGMTVTGGSVPAGTYIVSGAGSTWTVSASVSQSSTSMVGARINWFGTQGGIFSSYFSGDGINAYITGGPNIAANTAYTVMLAYKLNVGLTADYGRLLNANTSTPDWLAGGYSNYPKAWFSNGQSVNLTAAAKDTVWHIDFLTFTKTVGNIYSSTNVQPTGTPTYTLTSSSIQGFNQLKLYSKFDGNECAAGNIGVVKVWTGVLTTSEIQAQYAAYKTRFGY